MTRKFISSAALKDPAGAYLPASSAAVPTEAPLTGSLDDILTRQMTALERVTRQLVERSSSGSMTKDEIQSLATCIKVTMDLKAKEKEILDNMTDEELKDALNGQSTPQSSG